MFYVWLFSFFPRSFLSYLTGVLARLELPWPLSSLVCKLFVFVFSINMNEAEHPLNYYKTIEDVFTRRLKPGSRPIESAFVSPADGVLVRSSPISKGELVQIKDWTYAVEPLLFGDGRKHPSFQVEDYSWFTTVYLAPHNYHRVHTPFAGTLTKIRYIPGDLWPVNNFFVSRLPQLFIKNERLVFEFTLANGGSAYVVMVGALNVGRMTTPFLSDFATNDGPFFQTREIKEHAPQGSKVELAAGDELGTFMLGSTVVLVLDKLAHAALKPRELTGKKDITLGTSLQ